MKPIERFADLLCCETLDAWREKFFKFGKDLGYEQTLVAILPDRSTPMEAQFAFLHHSYSPVWVNKYDNEKMCRIDPRVAHCLNKTIPLVWTPEIFSEPEQKELYEEAGSYGIRSGVSLPIHGPAGETGILCFVSDMDPGRQFQKHAIYSLPELSFFRDFIFESSATFTKAEMELATTSLTKRELECLKWGAAGKSSWEIGQILNCTEATVNFHFGNIRRKLNSKSRQQAVVKAVRLGLIYPS